MPDYIKYCAECQRLHLPKEFAYPVWGYKFILPEEATECEYGHPIKTLNVTYQDFKVWMDVAIDPNFFDAMIKLHDEDIIEYELKMSQLRTQVEQQKAAEESNKPKCPTCQSTNIRKITTASKATNAVLFGLFGNKRKMQFHCNNCGYEW
ncbi:hypothetical protein H8S37_04705 [Mediterraneibacter sp. NSJ-55]|uniref:Uncharacterized protein n=1 Tax=Mediterraneibacter hominis TaxID=2763054 RepID=A0A923RP79_9FIRM|nr:hypothetical protein [Mediterraneibacter hominis]MBC5688229.1 hypothetical protein [Mediterraneibacter hominis]